MTRRAWPLLQRLSERLTLAPLPSPAWLREGLLWPLVAPLLLVAVFPLAGIVRTVTGVPIVAGLAIAAPLWLLALRTLLPALRARHPGDRLHLAIGCAVVAAVSAFAIYCLYNRLYGGLSNYRGTDAGFHVDSYHRFVANSPQEYHGFVTTYALFYFIQHLLHLDMFWTVVVFFYGEVFAACALPLLLAFSLLWPLRNRARVAYGVGVALTAAAAAAVQYLVILPQQHQNQADGFYGHLFGLTIVLVIWLADALLREPLLRAAALAAGFVACRFTYGLNLGDLGLCIAALLALDVAAPRLRRPGRLVLAGGALAFAAAGYLSYRLLWPVRALTGHVVPFNVDLFRHAQALALGLLLVAIAGATGSRALFAGGGLRRAARFPLLFGAINLGAIWLYLRSGEPRVYYFVKYPMAALIVVAAAVSVLVPVLLARALAELGAPGLRRALAPLGALAASALGVMAVRDFAAAQPLYRAGFADRAWERQFSHDELNLPLADLGAWKRIEDTLRQRHKRFGGYIVSQFGMAMFMNAALGYPDFGWNVWFAGPVVPPPQGSCLFWDEGSPRAWWVWEYGFPLKGVRTQLELDSKKQCVHYRAHWDPDGPPRTLCHLCN